MLDVRWWVAVLVDIVVWPSWSLVVGRVQAGRGTEQLLRPGPITRLRPAEIGGAVYERRLHIKRWKDLLPEAGGWFGGTSKRTLPAGDRDMALLRFTAECVRAERTHLGIVAITPAFVIWNPLGLFVANVVFALVANVPCIVVPRYNRARIAGMVGSR